MGENAGVDWFAFCREVCEQMIMDRSEPIGGVGVRVQIDESKVGKRKYNKGHRVEGQWVFAGIEEESRKCFMVTVEKRDHETLLPLIQKWIKPGTTIVSDGWRSYNILNTLGYEHLVVNHSIEFVNPDGDHTNKIEGHWRLLKASLPPFGARKFLFSGYLAEFMWRYKYHDDDLFKQFITDISTIYPI